jgi:hypothetical protein
MLILGSLSRILTQKRGRLRRDNYQRSAVVCNVNPYTLLKWLLWKLRAVTCTTLLLGFLSSLKTWLRRKRFSLSPLLLRVFGTGVYVSTSIYSIIMTSLICRKPLDRRLWHYLNVSHNFPLHSSDVLLILFNEESKACTCRRFKPSGMCCVLLLFIVIVSNA